MKSMRRPGWLLIAVTMLIAIGHVCALPEHALAANPDSHHQSEAAPHHGPAGDETHLESCEGLRSAPAKLVVVLAAGLAPFRTGVYVPVPRPLQRTSFVAASPPLFLLHASLLI